MNRIDQRLQEHQQAKPKATAKANATANATTTATNDNVPFDIDAVINDIAELVLQNPTQRGRPREKDTTNVGRAKSIKPNKHVRQ